MCSAVVGGFWSCPQQGVRGWNAVKLVRSGIRRYSAPHGVFTLLSGQAVGVQGRWCTQGFCCSCSGNSKCVSRLRPTSIEPSLQVWIEELWSFSICQNPFIFFSWFYFGKLSHHFYPSCKCMRIFRNGNVLKTRTILANEVIC